MIISEIEKEGSLLGIISAILRELRDEYLQDHHLPWVIGFSGGKDSTILSHLVFEMILSLSFEEMKRPIYIVSNDTLVESPLVLSHVEIIQKQISKAIDAWSLPITVVTTKPDLDATFWVNLIGRGYASPNRFFRWCTDRLKIQPTSRFIQEEVTRSGEVILLLGVRRDESATRAASVARYDNGQRLHPHNDLKGCKIFRPIVDLPTDDVWEFLASNAPPWGGSHDALIKLYRDASGGECPVVTDKSDAPSCGSSSSRFGCWTCTVVEKDRSLEGFVEVGFTEFGPLVDFRDWLVAIRNDPARRSGRRRDGRITFTSDGVLVPGPFTFETREEILSRLISLQGKIGKKLISPDEIERIKAIWAADAGLNAAYASADPI